MRKAIVYLNRVVAGTITELSPREYLFRYDDAYYQSDSPAISLTMSKSQQEYRSPYLFPFFFNMLSEGHNRKAQARSLHIDENDHFGILLATARWDTAGAITVQPVSDNE